MQSRFTYVRRHRIPAWKRARSSGKPSWNVNRKAIDSCRQWQVGRNQVSDHSADNSSRADRRRRLRTSPRGSGTYQFGSAPPRGRAGSMFGSTTLIDARGEIEFFRKPSYYRSSARDHYSFQPRHSSYLLSLIMGAPVVDRAESETINRDTLRGACRRMSISPDRVAFGVPGGARIRAPGPGRPRINATHSTNGPHPPSTQRSEQRAKPARFCCRR